MARFFDDASSEFLHTDGPPVTEPPFCVSIWFYDDDGTQNDRNLFQIQDKDVSGHYFRGSLFDSADNKIIIAVSDGSGFTEGVVGNTYNANEWNHGFFQFASATDRTVWLNANDASKGTNTVSRSPANIDSMDIGNEGDSTPGDYWSGGLAEMAIWSVADFTLGEIAALSKGFSPWLIRPQSLVFYAPMIRDEDRDLVGGITLTPNNTPSIMPHPRMYYPTGYNLAPFAAAAPGGTAVKDLIGMGFIPFAR